MGFYTIRPMALSHYFGGGSGPVRRLLSTGTVDNRHRCYAHRRALPKKGLRPLTGFPVLDDFSHYASCPDEEGINRPRPVRGFA